VRLNRSAEYQERAGDREIVTGWVSISVIAGKV
jgi:hypothetical protein